MAAQFKIRTREDILVMMERLENCSVNRFNPPQHLTFLQDPRQYKKLFSESTTMPSPVENNDEIDSFFLNKHPGYETPTKKKLRFRLNFDTSQEPKSLPPAPPVGDDENNVNIFKRIRRTNQLPTNKGFSRFKTMNRMNTMEALNFNSSSASYKDIYMRDNKSTSQSKLSGTELTSKMLVRRTTTKLLNTSIENQLVCGTPKAPLKRNPKILIRRQVDEVKKKTEATPKKRKKMVVAIDYSFRPKKTNEKGGKSGGINFACHRTTTHGREDNVPICSKKDDVGARTACEDGVCTTEESTPINSRQREIRKANKTHHQYRVKETEGFSTIASSLAQKPKKVKVRMSELGNISRNNSSGFYRDIEEFGSRLKDLSISQLLFQPSGANITS